MKRLKFYLEKVDAKQSKGSFINDVTQRGGSGVRQSVTLGHKGMTEGGGGGR